MTAFLDDGARLHAAVRVDGDLTTVALTGEVDRVSGPPLAKLLAAALDRTPRRLDVRMDQVCFLDVGGARVLMHAQRLAADQGTTLTLRDPQLHVLRVLRIMDPDTPLLGGAGPAPEAWWAGERVTARGDRDRRADERDRAAEERDLLADQRDRRADQRDWRADARDRRADDRDDQADDRDRLARERDRLVVERQLRVREHERWQDIREDVADTRERDLEERERS